MKLFVSIKKRLIKQLLNWPLLILILVMYIVLDNVNTNHSGSNLNRVSSAVEMSGRHNIMLTEHIVF